MPGHRLAMWVCGYVWGYRVVPRVRRAHAPQDVLDQVPWSPPRGTSSRDPNSIASVGTSTWASRTRTGPSRSSFGLQPTGFQSPRHRSRSSDQAAPSTQGRTRPPSSILILMRPRLGPSKARPRPRGPRYGKMGAPSSAEGGFPSPVPRLINLHHIAVHRQSSTLPSCLAGPPLLHLGDTRLPQKLASYSPVLSLLLKRQGPPLLL